MPVLFIHFDEIWNATDVIENFLNMSEINILQSKGTFLEVNKKIFLGKLKDTYINSLIY